MAMTRDNDLVLEAGSDGAFDIDALSEPRHAVDAQLSEHLREKGNAAFQSKAFALAQSFYTQAIDKNPQNHLLYSNRSAARCQLQQFELALEDAQRAIQLAPKWSKAYARQAAACEGLKRWGEAIAAHERIVELEASPSTPEAKKATAKIVQLRRRSEKNTTGAGVRAGTAPAPAPAVQKGFFHDASVKATSAIYVEKDDIVKQVVDRSSGATRPEREDERRWRYMLRRLKTGCNKDGVNASGEKVVLDDGVFAKLLHEREFQALVYPGIPKEQLVHAPKNLQELLEDPSYEDELLLLMDKVQAKAESVLHNVKQRGAAQGETMDAATEQMLRPQVLQEAFAREVLAMVHRVNYKKHVLLANDARTLADPQADEATWDQLPDAVLDAVLGHVPASSDAVAGVAVLDAFMGDEWVSLLQNDAERMARNGQLIATTASPLTAGTASSTHAQTASGGRMRFVEKTECELEYPALAELIEKLHALPFEINRKRPAQAQLCAQFAHCTALQQLRAGEQQRLRLDCGAGDKDNGFKLTCVYFISALPCDSADERASGLAHTTALELRTQIEMDARVQRVAPLADRLVLFQSQRVLNEITALAEREELYYMTFWIHGKCLR